MEEEIGALRVVLARLMGEVGRVEDPERLSLAVARVANAVVRARRAQAVIGTAEQAEFQEMLDHILREMSPEAVARQREEEAREAAEEAEWQARWEAENGVGEGVVGADGGGPAGTPVAP